MSKNGFQKELLKGIDKGRLEQEDSRELKKFRENISRVVSDIMMDDPDSKRKRLQALKDGAWGLIGQLPVITPVVTAMFQSLLGEDLGSKMDTLGYKIDTMIGLQKETLAVSKETLEKTDKVIKILDERLPQPT